MLEIPDRIYIDKKDRILYDKLDHEEILRFKGGNRTRKEQFLFSMAIGFKNNIDQPLKNKDGFVLIKNLQPEDEALLNSIAINKTNSVDILTDKSEVFKIAEEYAHAGIRLLFDKIESAPLGSFDKQLEKELHEIYNKISFK